MMRVVAPALLGAGIALAAAAARSGDAPPLSTPIIVDAAADVHPISPLIYGISFASPAVQRDLRLALVRSGGNSASLYDWRDEARGAGRDWFFESLPIAADDPAQYGARFVAQARAGGAAPMLTVPMTGWAASLGPGGGKRAAFAIDRYGEQAASDRDGFANAGNGIRPNGTPITGNDPHDAAHRVSPEQTRAWLASIVARFGPAARGGVRFYAMDNEPARWHDIHRDVFPIGLHAQEQADRTIAYARLVKDVDPQAMVVAPEAEGWTGYQYSGFDQQIGEARGWHDLPDHARQTHGMALIPWLLDRWRAAGHPVDVVSVHFYPQGGEFSDDVSPAMQRRRNRSTRALWDPAYRDESWIAAPVALIPRLRGWVREHYVPGTPVAITEYDWGAARHMNGATAQADVLGIFAREGLDMAARWLPPAPGTPAYLAMKLFRNPRGQGGGFGEVSVAARAPAPDDVATFAALRRADGALTIVAINKQIETPAPLSIALMHFSAAGRVIVTQLSDGRLSPLSPRRFTGGRLTTTLPAQSVTLFELLPDVS